MSRQRDDVPHANTSGWLDHSLFMIVAAAGSLIIVLARVLDVARDIGPWFAVLLAVLFMVGYLCCVVRVERFRLRADQAGDNMYYLGFIYTLVSLSVALYQFQAGEKTSQYIAANFGIALVTTILGVALRVLLHQMREDPVDVERDARMELAQAAARLRSELDTVVLEFGSFRRGLQQIMTEGYHEVAESTKATIEAAATQYRAALETATGTLVKAFSTFNSQSEQLLKEAEHVVHALERLVERVDGIDSPADMVQRLIAPAVQHVDRLLEQLEQYHVRSQESAKGLADIVSQVQMAASALHEALKGAESSVRPFTNEALHGYSTQIARLTQNLGELTETAEASTAMQRDMVKALGTNVQTHIDAARAAMEQLTKDHESHRSQQRAMADSLKSDLEEAVARARAQREALSRELQESERAATRLLHQLTELASLMAEGLARAESA